MRQSLCILAVVLLGIVNSSSVSSEIDGLLMERLKMEKVKLAMLRAKEKGLSSLPDMDPVALDQPGTTFSGYSGETDGQNVLCGRIPCVPKYQFLESELN